MISFPRFGLTIITDVDTARAHVGEPNSQLTQAQIDRFVSVVKERAEARKDELAAIPDSVKMKFAYRRSYDLNIKGRNLQLLYGQLGKRMQKIMAYGSYVEFAQIKWTNSFSTNPIRQREESTALIDRIKARLAGFAGFDPNRIVPRNLPPLQPVEEFVDQAFDTLIREWKASHPR